MNIQLKHTALIGKADYIAALDTLCHLTQHSLLVFDKNFEVIGFNSESRENTLRQFFLANPRNRLHLLTHDTVSATQYCPRLISLLRQFSHCMYIYQTPQHLSHLSEPFAVADQTHYARRFHIDDLHGMLAQHDPEKARTLSTQFKEMWAASRPGIKVSTLGL